ncbi:ABC transporter permease [Nocardioides convexus]|uniref:ABC transporter permease n=1 Tax=Nocardioides convexus TaxID=2712224 RepID=UPI0024187C6B|nr:ABC transporter permease [Nocardioides convexus]
MIGKPVLLACRALFTGLFGTTGRLAGENALRDPRRTGATASALMIGLALVSTIGVLAASLNKSVDDVVDEQFTADLLVQSTTFLPFSTEVGDRIEKIDGVGTMSRQRTTTAQYDGKAAYVTGVDPQFTSIYHLDVVEGTERISGAQAFVSKDFAKKHAVKVGDSLDLSFQGNRKARAAGRRHRRRHRGLLGGHPAAGRARQGRRPAPGHRDQHPALPRRRRREGPRRHRCRGEAGADRRRLRQGGVLRPDPRAGQPGCST